MGVIKLMYSILVHYLYASLIFVLILWWLQRFYRRLKALYYCSLISFIIIYVYKVLSRVFFWDLSNEIYDRFSFWIQLRTDLFFMVFSFDPYESYYHPKNIFFAVRYLFETMFYTVILFGTFIVGSYLWKIMLRIRKKTKLSKNVAKEKQTGSDFTQEEGKKLRTFPSITLFCFKLLSVPILLISTPFILVRSYSYVDERKAINLTKQLVLSTQNQTDFYKQHLNKRSIGIIENHLQEIQSDFKIMSYASSDHHWYSYTIKFENGFELFVTIMKLSDDTFRPKGFWKSQGGKPIFP